MMFGYGSSWPFWQIALTWVGMIAFWGAADPGRLRPGRERHPQARPRPGTQPGKTWAGRWLNLPWYRCSLYPIRV